MSSFRTTYPCTLQGISQSNTSQKPRRNHEVFHNQHLLKYSTITKCYILNICLFEFLFHIMRHICLFEFLFHYCSLSQMIWFWTANNIFFIVILHTEYLFVWIFISHHGNIQINGRTAYSLSDMWFWFNYTYIRKYIFHF